MSWLGTYPSGKQVTQGDRVLLNDGREVFVLQAAELDAIFQFSWSNRRGQYKQEWSDTSQVAWNYSEIDRSAA